MAEFSVPLLQGPTEEIKSTSMVVVNSSSLSSSMRNPVEENKTDVDYDDAQGDLV
jgi:hypothetical protein